MENSLPVIQRIDGLLRPSLAAMAYELVQVRLIEKPSGLTLQIMAERNDKVNMTVEDCSQISHTVSALLDVEDPISDAYELEVSSPGVDRPLVRMSDYTDFAGHEAKVETAHMIEGRKRWRGTLRGVDAEDILLQLPDAAEVSRIPFSAVSHAKLVLTDELIRKYLKNEKQNRTSA